jgi:hypothetical protein
MSLGKEILDRVNNRRQRNVIEVPEWGEDDAPLLVYVSPLTIGDIDKLQRKHKNFLVDMQVSGMVDMIIMKAENKDGDKLFTLEDKVYLMKMDLTAIANIAGKMMNSIDGIEAHEKN